MEKKQTGKTLRFHPPYHFVALPLAIALFVWSLINVIQSLSSSDDDNTITWFHLLISICIMFTLMIVRRYATKTQDRIVRVEEQFRHYRLTGHEMNDKLSAAQIIALRNASDQEFPELCKRAAKEDLNPEQIRSNIKHWRPDSMRI